TILLLTSLIYTLFPYTTLFRSILKSHKTSELPVFGKGKDKDRSYWNALLRQVTVAGLLRKDIESYGVIRLTDEGEAFMKNPTSRSEEHTSELQSRFDLVCRLLL